MSRRTDQKMLRGMLSDLLDVETGLSDWEVGFIENLGNWEGDFTDAQSAALEKTWNKHCLRV